MIKKIAFSIIALLSIITASAQSGSWKIHPVFGATPTNAIDVGDRIYYLVSNNLFCYDKETSENIMYDKSNYLNDTQISNVYYNYDKKYLVVAYSNSDIDIILENGRVKNIPDITNSLMPSLKTINHVTFNGNRIYVATAFGYVVIDDEKFEIAESRIYNKSITSAAVCGNYLLLSSADGTYIGLASKAHSTLDSFVLYANEKKCKFLTITDKRFLTYGTNAIIYDIATDADGNPTGLTWVKTIGNTAPSSVQPVKSLGVTMVLYPATPQYYKLDANGEASAAITLPTAVKSELLTSQETDKGSWWAIGSNGIHKVTIEGIGAGDVLKGGFLNTIDGSFVELKSTGATTLKNTVAYYIDVNNTDVSTAAKALAALGKVTLADQQKALVAFNTDKGTYIYSVSGAAGGNLKDTNFTLAAIVDDKINNQDSIKNGEITFTANDTAIPLKAVTKTFLIS